MSTSRRAAWTRKLRGVSAGAGARGASMRARHRGVARVLDVGARCRSSRDLRPSFARNDGRSDLPDGAPAPGVGLASPTDARRRPGDAAMWIVRLALRRPYTFIV